MNVVEIVLATSDKQISQMVVLEKVTSVREVIERSKLDVLPNDGLVGVWGKIVPLDFQLQGGERVEIYRPTRINPREVRRLKAIKKHVGPSGQKS